MNDSGITIVIHGLSGGGAERSASVLADCWAAEGRDVTLVTFKIAEDEAFSLSGNVKRIAFDDLSADNDSPLWGKEEINIGRLELALRKAGNRNVVSFLARMNLRCLLADSRREYNIFACERSYPKYALINEFDEKLRRLLYPYAKKIVIQTEYGSRRWIEENIPGCKVSVIPNCITDTVFSEIESAEIFSSVKPYILSSGRLVELKRYDLLLKIYAGLVQRNPAFGNIDLKIAGDGELAGELERLAEELGVAERVDFLGWRSDIYSLMKGALCLAHTSDYEGFPNVILEAMFAGTPAIAFDCLTGPRDIITDKVNGILVGPGDLSEYSCKLERICLDGDFRVSLRNNMHAVQDKFSQGKIVQMWNRMIWG